MEFFPQFPIMVSFLGISNSSLCSFSYLVEVAVEQQQLEYSAAFSCLLKIVTLICGQQLGDSTDS